MKIKVYREKQAEIPADLMGLFIEDINYAIDGGLYAEMIENKNFESLEAYGGKAMDYYLQNDGLYGWSSYPDEHDVELKIVTGSPANEANPHYLRVECKKGEKGFLNQAYDGIYMKAGLEYRVSFWARVTDYEGELKIGIIKDGHEYAKALINVKSADEYGWKRWNKYEVTLVSKEEIRNGQFVIALQQSGIMEFDYISMIPSDAVVGIFRKDIVEMMKELNPGFLRFPGGCIVEGATLSNRYRFKDTLGPIEGRKHNWNRWALHDNNEANNYHSKYAHYGQTLGIGFYEYFLLCEILGAKPLPVLSVGLACQYQSHEKIELDDPVLQEYIQDMLDLIEFANGGTDTKWGSVRAAMGHTEPFKLDMIGVGNEQWETEESQFFKRYTIFEKAIHELYPDMKLIGTAGPELNSERYNKAWEFYRNAQKKDFVYAVDEHFYIKPQWFLENISYYDNYPRDIKVFFGEYAAHTPGMIKMNRQDANSLESALSEAAFLTGIERNSDVVVMACYAPLFARVGYTQWVPDLIWFDEKDIYATPNYYVQQMYAKNLGSYNLKSEGEGLPYNVSFDEKRQEIIVKIVNYTQNSQDINIELETEWNASSDADVILLVGTNPGDYNTLQQKKIGQPIINKINIKDDNYDIPPYSFAILRIPIEM